MSKIDKIKSIYELTPMQEGMLFHSLSTETTEAYCNVLTFTIEGILNINSLEESFNRVIERYDVLRTIFNYKNFGKAVQVVLNQKKSNIMYIDISNENEEDKSRYIKQIVKQDNVRKFDLTKDILMRIMAIKQSKDRFSLIVSYHHIIMDGWCLGIVIRDLLKIYNEIEHGKEANLEMVYPYLGYIEWIRQKDKEGAKSYWGNYLLGYNEKVSIPFENELGEAYKQKEIVLLIGNEMTDKIEALSMRNKVTVSTVMQSIWALQLQKYNNVNDSVFGYVVSGRNPEVRGIESMVGLFINTIPLRLTVEDGMTYKDVLEKLNTSFLKNLEYDYYPLSEIQSLSNLKSDLINNIMVFENYPINADDINRETTYNNTFKIIDINVEEQTSYDFNIIITHKNYMEVKFRFNENRFSENDVLRIKQHFFNILTKVVENENVFVNDIELIGEDEKKKILLGFNNTKANYPRNSLIHELFEKQVQNTPNNIAVAIEDKQLTYKELNERANSLASVLRENGVNRDVIVSIMVERSIEMIVGIIAILKAGGAYLPIDPEYPKDRINYMLKDSHSRILLTKPNWVDEIEFDGIILDLSKEELFNGYSSNLERINESNDIAYIIYTSGTTGKPKGVMVENNNVIRLMFNDKMKFDFCDKDVWTMFHSYCFDFSVWEMYGALLYGGKLVIVPKMITKDLDKYIQLLQDEKVTVLNQTPTAFYNLMNIEANKKDSNLNLRYIIFGGEALNPKMLEMWKKRYDKTKIVNMYGITETTVHVTYKEIEDKEIKKGISNIGTAIPTLTTYVMDKNLKLQPIGVAGELCVGGDGVARGYLNSEDLTSKKFVMNPYIKDERIYKSGDLVKLLENGEMEYLGRIDNQVKIRGFRIEIGEIENKLISHKDLKEVAVVVIEDKDKEKYICAYVVSKKDINELDLSSYLKKSLPEYMIPTYYVQLESMPLTTNGKLDRKALPKPDIHGRLKDYEAPRNKIEMILQKIWSEVLGIEKIGISDNFFELGGHSLKATVLISKIHKALDKDIPIKELFRLPTIKELSAFIENQEENIYSKIEKVQEKDKYETSSAQKRMYMLQQFDKDSIAYNMPVVFELDGTINKKQIEDTFKMLVVRHEALRTYFQTDEDEIVQKIDNSTKFKLEVKQSKDNIDTVISRYVRPFDLRKAPLLRVELVENGEKTYLLIDMHHIISDGVSTSILIKDFITLYKGDNLEPLKLQYKDFSEWQNKFLKSEEIKKQEEYWLNVFNDQLPILNMATDYERPAIQSFEGDNVSFEIDEKVTQKLKILSKETGTTMHMILLSAFNILLSKYSGQEDIVIGVPIAGRPHADIQKIMGMFVNTLALRNRPEGNKRYSDFLKEVKENSLKAYENQSYQLDELIEKLDIVRDPSRNPLFDVMFDMGEIKLDGNVEIGDLILKPYDMKNKTAKFDLILDAIEKAKTVEVILSYCLGIFHKETAELMLKDYYFILDTITNDKNITISDIELKHLECDSELELQEFEEFSL